MVSRCFTRALHLIRLLVYNKSINYNGDNKYHIRFLFFKSIGSYGIALGFIIGNFMCINSMLSRDVIRYIGKINIINC